MCGRIGLEGPPVLLGVRVVVLKLELVPRRDRLHGVLLVEHRLVDGVPVGRSGRRERRKVLRRDLAERQEVEDLRSAAIGVPVAGERADERIQDVGEALGENALAGGRDRDLRLGQRRVGERVVNVLEGVRPDSLVTQPAAEGPDRVDHPGVSGLEAEEDQPPPAVVRDLLVVHQGAAELHQAPQHRHVVLLPLRDVREEHVHLAGREQLGRHLLDSEDHAAGCEVRADGGTGFLVGALRKGADLRRLDHDAQVLALGEHGDVVGCQGDPALPAILRLAADSDHRELRGAGQCSAPAGFWPGRREQLRSDLLDKSRG